MNKIKLAAISDSVLLTSGFANVARPIIYGFHEAGYEVYSFGTMDTAYDFGKKLPFMYQPANPYDEMGHRTVALFLTNVQPDIIFILFDPGNLDTFVSIILALQESGNIKKCPIIAYTPIEGVPIPSSTANTVAKIINNNGKVILYSPKMIELFNKQFPGVEEHLDFAYHGLDHAPFQKYSDLKRTMLRDKVGWSDYFVVGSVGVNKRTKGFDTIIYTARMLRDLEKDEGIKFYLHTSLKPTMWGYNLKDMAINYGVDDMIIFKPEEDVEPGGNLHGTDYQNEEEIRDGDSPLLALSFIDRLNCLDCYLDLSQVEGWGLPTHEAMRCGVPTISLKDNSIRSEILNSGAMLLDPEPFRVWTTWHTGVKLVLVDPYVAAQAILEMKNASDTIKNFWSKAALNNANQFDWQPTKDKFVRLVKEMVDEYDYNL